MEEININNKKALSMQAYIDYYNTVGNADGGKLFTPEQYEEYKNHLRKNASNRVYTSWRNIKGMDCKMIGPASTCLCGHRYKDHNYINPIDKKVHCKVKKCFCPCFYSVPVHGSNDFKCLCKASYTLHDPITKKCPKGKPGSATGRFASTWSCSCGYKFGDHVTVFESREERVALGKPVDDLSRMMREMGVITGENTANFSSMVDRIEGFGTQIDAIGSLEHQTNSLRYPHQKQSLSQNNASYENQFTEFKHSHQLGNVSIKRLTELNQQIGLEKEINTLSVRDEKSSRILFISEQNGGSISALDLYNSPHNFARVRISIRKPLKF